MACCNRKCKKYSALGVASVFLVIGILLVSLWSTIFTTLLNKELVLTNSSTSYKMWKETPIPIYFEIYMFNWTNSEEVLKDWNVKPVLQECGPYTFLEHHIRVNLEWNKDDTVTYQQKRIWKFLPERSNGSLSDQIINVNPVALTVANLIKDRNIIIKKAVDIFLEEKEKSLVIKKKVHELLFDGYEDELLTLLQKLNISTIPFNKFGWFFSRNNSETYDGTFKMYTGKNDVSLLGLFEDWNGYPATQYYSSYCSYVNGTSGELWPPVLNYPRVTMFVPDMCSSLSIDYGGIEEVLGIDGKLYIGEESVFDNGTKYPDMACFSTRQVPSGVRDISKCKFGAPAYMSYPHFYLADPSYRSRIIGMKPSKEHQLRLVLEPTTGIPLNITAQLQLNLLVEPISGVSMFSKVKTTFMPVIWFRQSAAVSEDLADQAKMLLILPHVFAYTGYGILGLSFIFYVIIIFISLKNGWKETDTQTLLSNQ